MTRTTATLLLALLATAPALAQPGFVTDPARTEGGAYAIDPNHAMVQFAVSHFGFSTFYGQFTQTNGSLTFDPKKPAASALSVTIPTASVSTMNDKLNGELKGDQWLDAQKFPAITFKATRIALTGARSGRITGDLTMHGVTKPVVLDATFNLAGTNPIDKKYTIGFEARTTVKRSDFGVKAFVPYIGDDVKVTISAPFEKAGS